MKRCLPEYFNRNWHWLSTWWQCYGKGKEVYIYILRSKKTGEMVAAVPLIISKSFFSGFKVNLLEVLGRGIGCEDLAIMDNCQECVRLIFEDLGKRANWHIAKFSRIANESCALNLMDFAKQTQYNYESWSSYNYGVQTVGNPDNYLSSRSKRFKRYIRTAQKRMQGSGQVRFETYCAGDNVAQAFESARKIVRYSWQGKVGTSHFRSDGGDGFIEKLIGSEIQGESKYEISFVLLNGDPVAYLYGVKRGKRFYVVDLAFDRTFSKSSPGRVLYFHLIKNAFADPDTEIFDFGGAGEYKKEYATLEISEDNLVLYNSSFYANTIYRFRKSKLYHNLKALGNNRILIKELSGFSRPWKSYS